MKWVLLTLLIVWFLQCETFNLIQTPFGLRPDICHHKVENKAMIKVLDNEIQVHNVNGTFYSLPILQECVEFTKHYQRTHFKPKIQQNLKRNTIKTQYNQNAIQNGWIDSASYLINNKGQNITGFNGTYTVPNNPPEISEQSLFYYVGIENVDSVYPTILQPVLGWVEEQQEWCISSWNCCPGGQTHQSSVLTGMKPSDQVFGFIKSSGENFIVGSRWNNKQVELAVESDGYQFVFAVVVLEAYYVASCNEFPEGPVLFSNLTLQVNDQTIIPSWLPSPTSECNGTVIVESPSQVSIQHFM